MNTKLVANANFFRLSGNSYPGRGLVLGRDETGKYLVQVYWIMGRSENSRNRVFSFDGDRVFTEAADATKVKDPSLIIYNAMDQVRESNGGLYVVSNGSQTDALIRVAKEKKEDLADVLSDWQYEPDSPNFTPRITGVFGTTGTNAIASLSILRKSPFDDGCDRFTYQYDTIAPGYGFGLTTYAGDGDPLPSFVGEPLLLPLLGNRLDIAREYWDALNTENRVALAVKFIAVDGRFTAVDTINKYDKV